MEEKFISKSGLKVTLRPARPEDSGEIVAALKSSSIERSYVLMDQYGLTAEGERRYIQGLDRERNLLLVAVAGDNIAGSLAALQADGGRRPLTAHVVEVGMHMAEPYRGQGIGTRLLAMAVEWARGKGYRKVVADIFTSQKRSLDIFVKAGFEQECYRKNQARMGREYFDEICMALYLD